MNIYVLMTKYKKDKRMLITFIYDSEIKSQRIFIEEQVSKIADNYPNYVFTIVNWKDGDFIANHFGLKDNGYIHITIIDFSNDNEYGGEIRSNEELIQIIEQLEKYTLKWTSQSITQKIFTFFRIKINSDEESKFNWYFGIIGSIIIIGLRCFFFARKFDFKDFIYFSNLLNDKIIKYKINGKKAKDILIEGKQLMAKKEEKLSTDEAKYIFFWGMDSFFEKENKNDDNLEENKEEN